MAKLLSFSFSLVLLIPFCSCESVVTEKQEDGKQISHKSPWTVSFTVSNDNDVQSYTGAVHMILIFEDATEEQFVAPDETFSRGVTYRYPTTFGTSSKLQYAKVRTAGMCSQPLKLVRLDFTRGTDGTSYSKLLNNLSVKDKCELMITGITDFHETTKPAYCIIGDKRYENGADFTVGCEARCKCTNGQVQCVDMCPVFNIRSTVSCQRVNVVGQCCQTFKCENNLQNGDCERPDVKRFTAEYNNGYPSAVYVCSDKECTQERVGAVLISSNWAMSPLIDNWSATETHLFIARPFESDIRRFAIKEIIVNETARLTLFRLNDNIPTTMNTQYANLPSTSDSCSKISSRQCPFTMVGWNFGAKPEDLPTLDIVTGLSVDVAQCKPTMQSNQSNVCLSNFSSSSPCRMHNGGPVFVQNDKDVNYLIGMKFWRSKNVDCQHPITTNANELVVNLCPALDWIGKTLLTRPVV